MPPSPSAADVAGSRDAPVGGRVELVLGDGARVDAEVVAVYARDLGFGPVVALPRPGRRTHHDGARPERADPYGRHGDAPGGAGRAGRVPPGPGPGDDAPGPGRGREDGTRPRLWINLAVLVVLLGYLLLSIANKLVATTAQRRTELAALRLIGTTPRQIRAMMRREAALIAATARWPPGWRCPSSPWCCCGRLPAPPVARGPAVAARRPSRSWWRASRSSPWNCPPVRRCASRPRTRSPAPDGTRPAPDGARWRRQSGSSWQIPFSQAQAAISTRLRAASLSWTLARCVLTVDRET